MVGVCAHHRRCCADSNIVSFFQKLEYGTVWQPANHSAAMIHYQRCPVCDSTHIQKVLTATDHTVSAESFSIWQCAHCSLRITQDVPNANDIGRYYKSNDY